jgi:REP element-mobilizing transposase RayT
MDDPNKISDVIRDLKRHTSQEITDYIEETLPGKNLFWLKPFYGKKINHVWQEGYHPVLLYSEKWFVEKLNYIHNNPVEKGFVERPEYWKYSSARNYILEDDSLIKIDRIL